MWRAHGRGRCRMSRASPGRCRSGPGRRPPDGCARFPPRHRRPSGTPAPGFRSGPTAPGISAAASARTTTARSRSCNRTSVLAAPVVSRAWPIAAASHRFGSVTQHLIGLLLGAEEDWPQAFEAILSMVGPIDHGGETHEVSSERLTIEPFQLDDPVRTPLVIDRLAHWYYHPREWLKKAALVNGTYLLNSPFTFQSMEKHSAYCAMVRLGLKVPATTLVPYKHPIDNVRW